ncbi:hypothetical protein B4U79_08949, partial [Dinothrombium tinctorium]
IVIQVGEEIDGTIMVRTATSDMPIPCPIKYTKETNGLIVLNEYFYFGLSPASAAKMVSTV